MQFFLIISSFVLFLSTSGAIAQGHSLYCEQADSTATTQKCLKRHLDSSQKRLSDVYKKLNDELESEKQNELSVLQKSWLTYRDAECMWEAENSKTPSLKHINELSCMARVTEDRADILNVIYDDEADQENVREYGSFPRWMNVVAKENPSIHWNYGNRKGMDLDCDGEDEYVMSGLKISSVKMEIPEEEAKILPQNYNSTIVIALAENPTIGRPTIKTFEFLVSQEESDKTICNNRVNMKFIAPKPLKTDTQEEGEATPKCTAKLEITASGCASKNIIWGNQYYILEIDSDDEKDNK
jgi:uncharacterized protein YecT (DUF1311 family)